MLQVRQTTAYTRWFASLRDRQTKARVDIRIRRLSLGNPGDVKSVGEGVFELRIDHGPGYRVYFIRRRDEYILLLAGGDKSTQDSDIREARALARQF
jgi:putative addiction module killer protein